MMSMPYAIKRSLLLLLVIAVGLIHRSWALSEFFYGDDYELYDYIDIYQNDIFYTPSEGTPNLLTMCVYGNGNNWQKHTYNAETDSNLVQLNMGKNTVQSYTFPATFNFLGQSYSTIYIVSQGYIDFEPNLDIIQGFGKRVNKDEEFYAKPRIASGLNDVDCGTTGNRVKAWVEKGTVPGNGAVVVEMQCNLVGYPARIFLNQIELRFDTGQVGIYIGKTSYVHKGRFGISLGNPPQSDVDLTNFIPTRSPEGSVTVTERTATTLTVTWNPTASYAYHFRVRAKQGSTFVTSDNIVGTSHTITGLQPNTAYAVEVALSCPKHDGTFGISSSPITSVSKSTLPGPVIGLTTTTVTGTSITFTWTQPGGATSYRLILNGGTPVTQSGTSKTYDGLTPATQYTFQVISGISSTNEYDSTASITVYTSPARVTGLQTNFSDTTTLTFIWIAPPTATRYNLELRKDGTLVNSANNIEVTTHTFNNLQGNVQYTVTVFAGNAQSFETTGASLTSVTFPAAPAGLTATVVQGTLVTISWTPSSGATRYCTSVTETGANQVVTTNSVTYNGLLLHTQYTIVVKSGVGTECQTTGSSLQVTTLGKTVTSVSFTSAGSNTIIFSWTNTVSASVFKVVLKDGDTVVAQEEGVTTLSRTFSQEVQPDKVYTCIVYAGFPPTNTYETVGKSATGTTLVAAPSSVSVGSTVDTTVLGFNWSSVTGATGYNLVLRQGANQIQTVSGHSASTSYTFTNLEGNKVYTLTVFAGNSNGYETVGKQGDATTLPLAPTGLTANGVTGNTITFHWQPAAGATSYHLALTPGNHIKTVQETTATFTELEPETSYTVIVRSGIDGKFQSVGTSLSQTTAADVVVNLHVSERTSTSLTFSWGAPEGANYYTLSLTGPEVVISAPFTTHTFNNLNSATTYTLTIFATFDTGDGQSTTLDGTTLPLAPSNVVVDDRSSHMLKFSWDGVTGSDIYKLTLTDKDDNVVSDVQTSELSRSFSGLNANIKYTLRVQSGIVGIGFETEGEEASGKTYPLPVTDIHVSERASDALTFSWTSADGADSYQAKLWEGVISGEPDFLKAVHTNEVMFPGLEEASTYSVLVFSGFNGTGHEEVGAGSTGRTFPNPPTDVEQTASTSDSLVFSWTVNTNADEYQLTLTNILTNVPSVPVTVTNPPYLFTSLDSNAEYSLKVQSGTSGLGFEPNGEVGIGKTRPGAVTELSCTEGTSNGFKVTWVASEGATLFRIEVLKDGNVEHTEEDISDMFASVSGLQVSGTSYVIRVFGGNAGGYDATPSVRSCFTLPSIPTSVAVSFASSDTLSFQWGIPSGANIFNARLYSSSHSLISQKNTTSAVVSFGSLQPTTEYVFHVYAGIADVGFEDIGASLSSVYTTVAPPTDLVVISETSTSISFYWTPASGASSAFIELRQNNVLITELSTAGDEFTIEGLSPYTTYKITVKSVNQAGIEPVGISVTHTTKPAPPTGITLTSVDYNAASFSWTPSPGSQDFRVKLLDFDDNVLESKNVLRKNTVSFTNLDAYTAYQIHIFAGEDIDSLEEVGIVFPFLTLAGPMTNVGVLYADSSSITVYYEPSPGATGVLLKLLNSIGQVLRLQELPVESTKRDVLEYEIEELTPFTTFTIQMFVHSPDGTESGGFSTNYTTFPPPSTNIAGEGIGASQIRLEWTPVLNAGSYRVERYLENDATVIDFLNVTTDNVLYEGLNSGVNFRFRLLVCLPQRPPCSNEGPSIVLNTESVICTRLEDKIKHVTWPAGTSTYNQTGICDDGYGGLTVRMCNEDLGNPGFGVWGDVIGKCYQLPEPVPLPQRNVEHDSVELLWSQPHRGKYFKLVIQYPPSTSWTTYEEGFTETIIEVKNLTPATRYKMRLYAGNEGGYGLATEFDVVTSLQVPQSLKVSDITKDSASVSWVTVTGAEFFRIFLKKDNEGFDSGSVVTGTSLVLLNLTSGTDYIVRVHSGTVMEGNNYFEPVGSAKSFQTLAVADEVKNDKTVIIIAIVVALVLLMIALLLIFFLRRRRQQKDEQGKRASLAMSDLLSVQSDTTVTSKTQILTGAMQNQQDTSSLKKGAPYANYPYKSSSLQKPIHGQTSIQPAQRNHYVGADMTQLNTIIEISVPGFLKLETGSQLRKGKKLGSGGAGSVFEGELLDLDVIKRFGVRAVAIKEVADIGTLTFEQNLERFHQEVAIMWSASMHHNIIKLVGYTENPNTIVTKIYETDLDRYSRNVSLPLPPQLAYRFVCGIVEGMVCLNNLGIVHRDLKPANVLLEPVQDVDGNTTFNSIICDFGLARVTREVGVNYQHFVTTIGFSPRYAAPEVFQRLGRSDVSADEEIRADVYSFGVIVWQILSRKIPWDGLSNKDLIAAVLKGERPSEAAVVGFDPMTVALLDLAKLCWQPNFQQRPSFHEISYRLR